MQSWNPNNVFTIAEIGGNHEGNFNKAKKPLELGFNSCADAIKFQIYKGDNLVNSYQDNKETSF